MISHAHPLGREDDDAIVNLLCCEICTGGRAGADLPRPGGYAARGVLQGGGAALLFNGGLAGAPHKRGQLLVGQASQASQASQAGYNKQLEPNRKKK